MAPWPPALTDRSMAWPATAASVRVVRHLRSNTDGCLSWGAHVANHGLAVRPWLTACQAETPTPARVIAAEAVRTWRSHRGPDQNRGSLGLPDSTTTLSSRPLSSPVERDWTKVAMIRPRDMSMPAGSMPPSGYARVNGCVHFPAVAL